MCVEEPKCVLEDGATRIFLNTRGKNEDEVPAELVQFLYYVEHTTDEAAEQTGSERIKRIHDRVRKVRNSEEVGVKYMQAWEEKYYEKEEARKEGLREGLQEGLEKGLEKGLEQGLEQGAKKQLIELIKKKLEKGKSVEEIADALEKGTDKIEKLIKEMELE